MKTGYWKIKQELEAFKGLANGKIGFVIPENNGIAIIFPGHILMPLLQFWCRNDCHLFLMEVMHSQVIIKLRPKTTQASLV